MAWWNFDKEYRISVNQDDWVTPEETLIDARSGYADIEQPIPSGVFTLTGFFTALAALAVLGGTAWIALVRHAVYADLAFRNTTIQFSVAPPRGIIVDRLGRPLVKNIPRFDVLAIARELPSAGELSALSQTLGDILGIPDDETERLLTEGAKKSATFVVTADVSKEAVLALNRLTAQGIYVVTGSKREYTDGPHFSTLIGYTGRVSKADLIRDQYYLPPDVIGRAGVEAFYEEQLRGVHGNILFSRGDIGRQEQEAVQGDTLALTVDADAQKALYNAAFSVLRESGLGSAAAIVQDPGTGAVLAMTSFPGFDNNIFSDAVSESEFSRLFESKARPLFNRVISGKYNPGSTIKPFIGMTALEEKVVDPDYTVDDCVSISIPNPANPSNPYMFRNWRPDVGPFDLRRAIAQSCNIYFFSVGGGYGRIKGLGADRIARYLSRGLADRILGIDLPGEESGFVPTPEWKQQTKHEPWYQGDTYNISIGQGDLLVTPLWINSYVSAIANGGTIWTPRVASGVLTPEGTRKESFEPQSAGHLPFSDAVIVEMKRDMRETVLSGTAKILQDLPVPAAAKSGTAETSDSTVNSLLTAFAPYDHPEIAVTVLVEGSASNQGYASRIVNQFMQWYFSQGAETVSRER